MDKDKCLHNLEQTVNNFLNDNCNKQDNNVLSLLRKIIIVEKETATAEILFNMLKENYFESDEATIEFINGLYNKNIDALTTYMDIYLEQLNNSTYSDSEKEEKIKKMSKTLSDINPTLVDIFKKKKEVYSN